ATRPGGNPEEFARGTLGESPRASLYAPRGVLYQKGQDCLSGGRHVRHVPRAFGRADFGPAQDRAWAAPGSLGLAVRLSFPVVLMGRCPVPTLWGVIRGTSYLLSPTVAS